MSKNMILQMRGWLMDCAWADLEPEDFEEMTDVQIVRGVERHYSGGLDQFKRDWRGLDATMRVGRVSE